MLELSGPDPRIERDPLVLVALQLVTCCKVQATLLFWTNNSAQSLQLVCLTAWKDHTVHLSVATNYAYLQ